MSKAIVCSKVFKLLFLVLLVGAELTTCHVLKKRANTPKTREEVETEAGFNTAKDAEFVPTSSGGSNGQKPQKTTTTTRMVEPDGSITTKTVTKYEWVETGKPEITYFNRDLQPDNFRTMLRPSQHEINFNRDVTEPWLADKWNFDLNNHNKNEPNTGGQPNTEIINRFYTRPQLTTITRKVNISSDDNSGDASKILPSIDELLKTLSKSHDTYDPTTGTTNVLKNKTITINVQDLPVTKVLYDGKPMEESFFKTQPSELKPFADTQNTISKTASSMPDSTDFGTETFTPRRTYSFPTFDSDKKFINSFDSRSSSNVPHFNTPTFPTISNTKFTSSFDINSSVPHFNIPTFPTISNDDWNKRFDFKFPAEHSPNADPINNFLSKVNLSTNDLLQQNGELKMTIADGQGRILTATFLLSSPVKDKEANDDHSKNYQMSKPIK